MGNPFFILFAIFCSCCICTQTFGGFSEQGHAKLVVLNTFWIINQGLIYSLTLFLVRKRGDNTARLQDDSVYVGCRCHPDLRHANSSAVVIRSQTVARFVLRLIRLAHTDYSWTIRSLQLADNDAEIRHFSNNPCATYKSTQLWKKKGFVRGRRRQWH